MKFTREKLQEKHLVYFYAGKVLIVDMGNKIEYISTLTHTNNGTLYKHNGEYSTYFIRNDQSGISQYLHVREIMCLEPLECVIKIKNLFPL